MPALGDTADSNRVWQPTVSFSAFLQQRVEKMGSPYDLIVLGAGGVGSAALYHAARRGLRVLGLDRYPAGHDQGSSHGQTRVIRQAYFEHPDYVPLLLRAYELWRELEAEAEAALFHEVGLIEVGPPDGVVAPGVLEADRIHQLGVQTLTPSDVAEQLPGAVYPEEWLAVYEPQAGYLLVEDCVRAHLRLAIDRGAEHRADTEVRSWRNEDGDFVVATNQGEFIAGHLIITAGPWAASLLADLKTPLRVLRKPLYWMQASEGWQSSPTYLFETSEGVFYGFPNLAPDGAKVAEHTGGVEVADPRRDARRLDERDYARVVDFLQQHLPTLAGRRKRHAVCYYTSTRDGHFLVDQHPDHKRLAFAAGLSGHGFKFTSVLGEALVDLATLSETPQPVEFLNCDRESLRGPH